MKRAPLKSLAFVIDGENYALDKVQLAKLNQWLAVVTEKIDAKHHAEGRGKMAELCKERGKVYAGVSGGNLTFSVTPTGLGTVFKVAEAFTGERIDLTDYENW